jgi:hypothetical protein
MKITKSKLKQIIKEELEKTNWEDYDSWERAEIENSAKIAFKNEVEEALENSEYHSWVLDDPDWRNIMPLALSMDELKAEIKTVLETLTGKSLKDFGVAM